MKTKEKKLTKVEMLRKHGIHLARPTAIAFANAFPGPIRDGSISRRMALALAKKGWIAPLTTPADMSELPDYEITPSGVAACKKIAAAEIEHKQQKKNRGTLQHA